MASITRAATQGEATEVKVLRVRREPLGKQGKDLHVTLAPVVPGSADPALRKLLGAGGLDLFLAVVGGDRLVVTMGQGGKARLLAIAVSDGPAGSAAAASPISAKATPTSAASTTESSTVIAEAVAAAGQRSLFYFLDLRQVIGLVAAAGGSPRLRLLSGNMRAPVPVMGGAKGEAQGKVLTLDLTLPPACFTGIGVVIQAAVMGGG